MKWLAKASLIFLCLSLHAAGCSSDEPEKPLLQIDSTELKKTLFTSHMEEAIKPGRSLLYCSTFQIAWNELKDNIIKEDIHLVDEPPMVKFLNKSLSTKSDISADCYVAMAGFGRDGILDKINKALRDKFGEESPVVSENLQPEWILAYAYLCKNLEFKDAFENLDKPIAFTSADEATAGVKAFGIEEYYECSKHNKLAKQVEILDYEDDSDFILKLKSTSAKDEIILAKVKPEETLLKTIESVQVRIESAKNRPPVDIEKVSEAVEKYHELASQGKKELWSEEHKKLIEDYENQVKKAGSSSLNEDDTLQIPKLDFDLKHLYSELHGKHFVNKSYEGYWIAEAVQTVRFRLDEKGVLLKSEARIVCGAESMTGPKRLVFDRPFLLYLKEKGAKYPYLAIWVGNTELMLEK